jgi:dethiobiotin synthetase
VHHPAGDAARVSPPRRFFVTGTDTGVGKTLVSAWLAFHLKADYWKPIQCGLENGEGDREVVERLSGRTSFPERYRLTLPRSPHVAAAAENLRIDCAEFTAPDSPALIVEGAGGVLVPINEREYMADLILQLRLPTVVVARGTLGGINHVLLTLEALRARGCPIAGVVFNGDVLPETVAAATEYGRTRVLACLPSLKRVDSPTLHSLSRPEL